MDFYCNIITTFNVPVDYDSNYELDDTTTTWTKDTLHWWQMYVYHIYLCTTNVIISGMYLDYKEVALVSVVKEMTLMMKCK